MGEFSLRKAVQKDQQTILDVVREAGLFPFGIHWPRFIVAVDKDDMIIACGQVHPRFGGSHELASISVRPAWQGQGVGSKIVSALQADFNQTLHLFCRPKLVTYYRRFGFVQLQRKDMPVFFLLGDLVINFFPRIFSKADHLAIMRWRPEVV